MNNVRQVPHPDKLYIQINDEDENTLSFSFNDSYTEEGIDPNAFDDYSLNRALDMLSLVFRVLHDRLEHKKQIPTLQYSPKP